MEKIWLKNWKKWEETRISHKYLWHNKKITSVCIFFFFFFVSTVIQNADDILKQIKIQDTCTRLGAII